MSSRKSKKEPLKFFQSSLLSPFKRLSPRMHEGTPRAQFQVTPKTFASVEKKSGKTKPKIARTLHLFRLYFIV